MAGGSVPLLAAVTANERSILDAAAAHIARALSEGAGEAWTCRCEYVADLSALIDKTEGAITITSLLVPLADIDKPWADVERDLRALYEQLCASGAPVMICTILRHVEAGDDTEAANRVRIRLRRLNLLATELSREYGAFVIDLDRILADLGARRLETDYRLSGAAATDVAGKAVALSIVGNALDEFASVSVQDAARIILERYRPMVTLAAEVAMPNLVSFGRGRRRQVVSTVTDTVQENHVGWLVKQTLSGQIGPAEAFGRLVAAVRKRGARESAALLASGISRMFGAKT